MPRSLTPLLSHRYLMTRKGGFISLVAWFAMLGIMLGVATLIIVTSLMNGIRSEMLDNFIGVDGHIELYAQRGTITDYQQLTERLIPLLPKGSTIIPRIEGQVLLSSKRGAGRGAQVIGLRAQDIPHKLRLRQALSEQALTDFAQGSGIIAGKRLAESLYVNAGEAITLISPQGRATAFGSVPRIKAYPLLSTFSLGMHALDSSLILIPYNQALIYFTLSRTVANPASSLEITLPNRDDASLIAARLRQQLGRDYRVYGWQQSHQSVFNALTVQRNVMVVILALIVLVAAFNIISSLVMLVKDKRADIAILRTLGMSKTAILRLFILTGMSIGVIGTLLGAVFGVLGAAHIEALKHFIETLSGQPIMVEELYFLSGLPTQTDPLEVLAVVAASLIIALLATLYPAYRAASHDPAETLRYG